MRRTMMIVGCAAALLGFAARASASPVAGWTAYIVSSNNNLVTRFDTATDAPTGTAIVTQPSPMEMAITPDGTTGYVTNGGDSSVTPIDLATGTPGTPIEVSDTPEGIAITPNGQIALVADARADEVTPIDLATGTPGPPLSIVADPTALAITPDGSAAYVVSSSGDSVTPLSLSTDAVAPPITVGSDPEAIAIAPNGSTAYVVNDGSHSVSASVSVISLATNSLVDTIPLGDEAGGIAITPNGATAFVGTDDSVTPITLATNTAGTPIPLGQATPTAVAITPDGTTAYVADIADDAVWPVNIATNTAGAPIDNGNGGPVALAITPDEAPTAAFTATPAASGQATAFDASASASPVGSIASYQWTFGDGQSATTTTGATSHIYATPGTYTVGLTVTNTAGTSLSQVFTGQTVSLQGGPQAATNHAITIAATPPMTTPPVTGTPAPTPTPIRAKLTGLRVSALGSTAGRLHRGRCVAPAPNLSHDKSCRRKALLHVSYRLNAPVRVTLTIARTATGRSVKGRCVKQTSANRSHPKCVRVTRTVGKVTERAATGARTLTLRGVIAGHPLGAGTYRLTVTPAGGASRRVAFRIKG